MKSIFLLLMAISVYFWWRKIKTKSKNNQKYKKSTYYHHQNTNKNDFQPSRAFQSSRYENHFKNSQLNPKPQMMVVCATCGLHLPQTEALSTSIQSSSSSASSSISPSPEEAIRFYCCVAHQLAQST